jgi:hypothetical protein
MTGKTSQEVLSAIGQRELRWLRQFGEPRYPREPLYREFYGKQKVDPRPQVVNLENYLKVAPHMVPSQDNLNKPTIRHPDLSPSNIFIESDNISSLIDWEHAVILPLFIQAKIPTHFQNYGDEASESFQFPALPENFESLLEDEKEKEMELYRRRQLHYYYLGYTSRFNEDHFRAMGNPGLVARNRLYDVACRPWEGDNMSLKAEMINSSLHWPEIADDRNNSTFPVKYTEEEIKECLDIDAQQKRADTQMQKFRDYLGINLEGWVPAGMYDEAKQKADGLKSHLMGIAESEEERKEINNNWPFQDHEELD